MNNLEKYLLEFAQNPDDPELNFKLGAEYQANKQVASAVAYYLRCAEKTTDTLLAYESLLHAANCFMFQGSRNLTVRGLLQRAITLQPERPEAYFLLSSLYEVDTKDAGNWSDSYFVASLGLSKPEPSTSLRNTVGYLGTFALEFQRAKAAWWLGLCDDARESYTKLLSYPNLPAIYQQSIRDELSKIDINLDTLHPVYHTESLKAFNAKKFDWGLAAHNEWFKNIVNDEIFVRDTYQKFFSVQKNDVVVDIGASVGPFSYTLKDKELKALYCFEPHPELFKTLIHNLQDTDAVCINKAIGSVTGSIETKGLFDENFVNTHDKQAELVPSLSFKDFIEEYSLNRIDFLKIDCEGGEYDVFTLENLPWIKNNVKFIAGEWHLSTPELKKQFRWFRDNILYHFTDFEVYSFDDVNIKHDLYSDWFIDYYSTINIYINNKTLFKAPPAFKAQTSSKKTYIKDKWKYSIAPTLEFTTIIPEKGCVVDCVFCPQRTLIKNYTGERRLSLDNFKRAVDKLPTEVRVTFAGFTEPWLNSDCTDMLLYAHERGHPISVFTTMVGVSKEDIERIKHIPFAGAPNGGFTVHLPDQERKAKHPITKKFVEAMEYLGSVSHEIQNFNVMSMGDEVHESIRHVFPTAPTYAMWSRAGNLIGERMLKPELQEQQFLSINHGDKLMTCGCDERLYHNIMLPNGDVSLCCMDYGLEEITGNLFENDYNDVIPNPYEVFNLCRLCENAIPADSRFIRSERKMFNV